MKDKHLYQLKVTGGGFFFQQICTVGSMDHWAAHSLLLLLSVHPLILASCLVYLQHPHLRFFFSFQPLQYISGISGISGKQGD